MSERSEFGLRAPLTEKRRGPPRLHAADRVRRRDFLVPFWSFKKGLARVAGESRALASFACLAWPRLTAKDRASALFARLTFVLSKVSKTAIAGHEPTRLRRAGPLRSSPDAARSPNSLRSDMGCSSAASGCGARLALRLDTSKAGKPKRKPTAKSKGKGKGNSKSQGSARADVTPRPSRHAKKGHVRTRGLFGRIKRGVRSPRRPQPRCTRMGAKHAQRTTLRKCICRWYWSSTSWISSSRRQPMTS